MTAQATPRRSILVVAPFLPVPADFGGAIRVYYLLRELARANDVILVAPAAGDDFENMNALDGICDVVAVPARTTPRHAPVLAKRALQVQSLVSPRSFLEIAHATARMQRVIDRVFLTRRVDAVLYEFTQMAVLRPARPCPTIVDVHNVEHVLLERVAAAHGNVLAAHAKRTEARKVRRLERAVWASATLCTVTSEVDGAEVAQFARQPPVVVPNGVDVQAFARCVGGPRRPHHVVFTGVMRHQPNVDGVRWYVEQVHPRVRAALPDATVSIVGADPSREIMGLASDSVTVTGRVDDIRPYLHEASAAIVPLFSGGGTRIKILEAFGAGTPVVSTRIGAEGLDVRSGGELLLADTAEEFAERVIEVLTDQALAQRLAEAGCRVALEQYDWSSIGERMSGAIDLACERAAKTDPARGTQCSGPALPR